MRPRAMRTRVCQPSQQHTHSAAKKCIYNQLRVKFSLWCVICMMISGCIRSSFTFLSKKLFWLKYSKSFWIISYISLNFPIRISSVFPDQSFEMFHKHHHASTFPYIWTWILHLLSKNSSGWSVVNHSECFHIFILVVGFVLTPWSRIKVYCVKP